MKSDKPLCKQEQLVQTLSIIRREQGMKLTELGALNAQVLQIAVNHA